MRVCGIVGVGIIVMVLSGCSAELLTLDVGTCFDDPDKSDLVASWDVPVVDCATPHDNEVYGNEDLAGDEYPGSDTDYWAGQVCLAAFEGYIGVPYSASIYEFSWFAPSNESWADGDREVICFVYDINLEKMTGSIKGVGQ